MQHEHIQRICTEFAVHYTKSQSKNMHAFYTYVILFPGTAYRILAPIHSLMCSPLLKKHSINWTSFDILLKTLAPVLPVVVQMHQDTGARVGLYLYDGQSISIVLQDRKRLSTDLVNFCHKHLTCNRLSHKMPSFNRDFSFLISSGICGVFTSGPLLSCLVMVPNLKGTSHEKHCRSSSPG